jgi:hypothetical protein
LNYSLLDICKMLLRCKHKVYFTYTWLIEGLMLSHQKSMFHKSQRGLYFQNIGARWNQRKWMRKWDMNTIESISTKPTPTASTKSWCLQPKPIEKLVIDKYNKKDNYNEIGFTRTSWRHTVGVAYIGLIPSTNMIPSSSALIITCRGS